MMKDCPILVIDTFPDSFIAALKKVSTEVTYLPALTRAEILPLLPEAEVVVMNSRIRIDEEALSYAKKLKLLCRAGVGMDHFDLPLLAERGVRVVNTPGANARSVGEQTVGMLLTLMHKIAIADREVEQLIWSREANRGTELGGKTVGIIGYGNTGAATAQCLGGFGCRILAYDKYKTGFGHDGVTEVTLDTLYEEADILTLHIPLNEETFCYAGSEFFIRFRKPIYFLNLARGPIADLDALLSAMSTGKIKGAALDVLPNEKMHTLSREEKEQITQLYATGKVIMTPHIGGWSHESLQRINDRLLQAVKDLIADEARD